MNKLIEVSMDNSMKIFIEMAEQPTYCDDPALVSASSGEKVIKKTQAFLSDSIDQIKNFLNVIAKSVINSELQPDEFELGFSVKFAADAGIVISSISTEANMNVKLTWKKTKEPSI